MVNTQSMLTAKRWRGYDADRTVTRDILEKEVKIVVHTKQSGEDRE